MLNKNHEILLYDAFLYNVPRFIFVIKSIYDPILIYTYNIL